MGMEQTRYEYRRLKKEEIQRPLFFNFIRRQIVEDCWRREEGTWCVKKDPFVDDWSEEDYAVLISCLRHTIESGGMVSGAFLNGKLKGFVSVEAQPFGSEKQYLDLTSIHVSEDQRGRGIGRTLFETAKTWAREQGAKKLYISAHSAVESQAFYKAMGCEEAQEYQSAHVEQEPYDCQLECRI